MDWPVQSPAIRCSRSIGGLSVGLLTVTILSRILLCATSVIFASLWWKSTGNNLTTETQRSLRLHRVLNLRPNAILRSLLVVILLSFTVQAQETPADKIGRASCRERV